jgi:glucose-1-phosphate thymidylyltransferase
MVVLTKVKDPRLFGVAEVDKGKLLRVVEKPKQPKSDLAITGVYMFTKPIFDVIKRLKPSWRNELEITDAIQMLLDEGRTVGYRMVDGWWKDTGKPEDLLEANHLILTDLKASNDGTIEEQTNIIGNVAIGKNTTIKNNTCIRGPVTIGCDCKIGPDTYVGPYTSIGSNVTIVGGEIENSIVMEGASISCDERIVDSLIGREARITSNSAKPCGYRLVIGDNTYIGF